MAARSTWKGFLQLSLVSIPVKAYTAGSSGGGEISLNQLHRDCHNRIQYKKSCPIHGEVQQSDIVMGYEYAKGQYVEIDTDELEKLRTPKDQAINIDAFVPAKQIDPVYFSGKNYYLTPDGPTGQKGYALLRHALQAGELFGVCRMVLNSKEQLVLIRPVENLISMIVLNYDSQVKKPVAFADEITQPEITAEERKLTQTLVDATTKAELDLGQYRDEYTAKLTKLIELKVEGKEIVAPPAAEEHAVINLMDALRRSVAQAKSAKPAPKKKMAASASQRKPATRKKKTG